MENPNNIVDFDYCLLKQHIALFVLNSLLLINRSEEHTSELQSPT